jgi:hypothetical protein
MTHSCRTCDAFAANPGNAAEGTCRAEPPRMFIQMKPVPGSAISGTPQMQQVPAGTWPPTAPDLWCRAWRARHA